MSRHIKLTFKCSSSPPADLCVYFANKSCRMSLFISFLCQTMFQKLTIINLINMGISETPKFGLGDLVKRELKGKNFLNIEPHSEKLRKRIVSKRGHVNIGKTRVSKRSVFPYIGQHSEIYIWSSERRNIRKINS